MVKKTMCAQLVTLGILLGGAVWLFTSFGAFSANVQCIIDQIRFLGSVPGEEFSAARDMASAMPSAILDQVEQSLPLIAIGAAVPAALIALLELLILFCTARAKSKATGIKCAMLLLNIALLIGLIFYIVIGAIGFAPSTPQGQDSYAQIENVCVEFVPEMSSMLTELETASKDAKADLDSAGVSPSADITKDFEEAEAQLATGKSVVASFETACGCVDNLWTGLASLMLPGFVCAFACVLIMFVNCCACKALGCCSAPPTKDAEGDGVQV